MAALFFCSAEANRPVGGCRGKPGGLAGWHPGALTSISSLVCRPLWGHSVGHEDPACRRRFPPWRAGSRRRRSAACEGIFFSNQKNIPSRFPRKILGAFASSQAPYPSPLPKGHRLTHSAAPPFPTAKLCGGSPTSAPRPLLRPKGAEAPFGNPDGGVDGGTGFTGDGGTGDGCLRSFRVFWVCGRRGLGWPGRSRTGIGCSSILPSVGAGLCPRPIFRG